MQIPTLSLLQQTPLRSPALLSFGKQPALKYCLFSLGTWSCQTETCSC